jgi:sugar-specific transcriptional regulator TrmB
MGLNALEAEVYSYLLRDSPLTGYGIAKAIGKPAANVYKAIDTLSEKGAVIVDDGATRQCRAVPARDFLMRLERDFSHHRREAEEVLGRFPAPGADTRVYQLRTWPQILEQCRQLLGTATQVVQMDIYPDPLLELKDDVAAAAGRGVQVVGKTYRPVAVPGMEVLIEPDSALILDRWPGQWVDVVADGSQFVLALLGADGTNVVQAVWSASPFLSYIHYGRLACELGYTALKIDIRRGAEHEELLSTFSRTYEYFKLDNPGYDRLLQQIGSFQTTKKENKR